MCQFRHCIFFQEHNSFLQVFLLFYKKTLLYLNLFLIFPFVHVWVWVYVCICGFFCVCQFILTRDLSILLIFLKKLWFAVYLSFFFSYFYSLLFLSCFFVFVNILFLASSIIKNRQYDIYPFNIFLIVQYSTVHSLHIALQYLQLQRQVTGHLSFEHIFNCIVQY